MALPRVKINFANGALGQVSPSADNVIGVLATGVVVPNKFALNTTYKLGKFADVTDTLGITEANNPGIYKLMQQLYDQAGDGAEVYLKGFADTVTLTNMATRTYASGVEEMLRTANGRIRVLVFHRTPATGYTPTVTAGIDDDCYTAKAAAQVTCDWAEATLKAPCMAIVPGLYYSGTASALTDLTTSSTNRVSMMIGDTVSGNGCAIGLLAGKLAKIPVQRNIGRVKDGAIAGITTAYLNTTKVEQADFEGVHDKGFITFRTHVGRSGYFFNDDPIAAAVTDDYNHITARRTVDKAYRVAYETLINEVLDEIPVTAAGKMTVSFAKSLENKVEGAIVNSMTSYGNLGADPTDANDRGVVCFVDPSQNVVSTGKIVITLKVKPYGYARYIEVNLGFQTLTV